MSEEIEKSLDALNKQLDELKLPQKLRSEIIGNESFSSIIEGVLENVPVASTIIKFMNTSERINSKLNDQKQAYLLMKYIEKSESQEQGLQDLVNILSDPYALSIYSKIKRIVDDNPPDQDLIDNLSSVLISAVKEDMTTVFDDLKFVLSQIETLPVQAIVILSNHQNWKPFYLGGFRSGNPPDHSIPDDFSKAFAHYYSLSLSSSVDLRPKIENAIRILRNDGMIIASPARTGTFDNLEKLPFHPSGKGMEINVSLSATGRLMAKYLSL